MSGDNRLMWIEGKINRESMKKLCCGERHDRYGECLCSSWVKSTSSAIQRYGNS